MTLPEWMEAHRRSLLFLLALLVLGGLASSFVLPVALFPHVNFPRVMVSLDAGDRPAERMAIEVTWPVEEAVRAVPGVRSVRSATSRGSAEISVNFDWGGDMVVAMLQVESAVNQSLTALPSGTTFTVRRMDPTVFPVLAYSLTSDRRSLIRLRDIALYQLRPLLSTVKGVAGVEVLGGKPEEYQVTVDPARLVSYGLSIDDVAKALSAANVLEAVGRLEDHYKLYLVVSNTRLVSLRQIGETAVRAGGNGIVRVEDVATVSVGAAPQWTRVTADGHDAVIFQIFQQPDGNTVQIARDAKQSLGGIRKRLPGDVRISSWYDQSELILGSASSVRDAMLIGVALSSLILLLFLRNARVTLIAVIAVPSVLGATILMLYVLHMSFNIMTLGGMAAAVGLIIDDTIVMLEHIVRRMRTGADRHGEQILRAVHEMTRPLAGSSTATIIVFTPLAFLSGVTGAFFKSLSLTIAASLLISFFVAWLAVPILAGRFLRREDAEQGDEDAITVRLRRAYEAVMTRALARPSRVLLVLALLVLLGWIGYARLGSGFMPVMDEGGFILDYLAAPGTSLTETDRLLRQVEAILRATPEVDTYSRRTGLQLGGGLTEANTGDFFVRLKPFPRRGIEEVMDDVRGRVETSVPGLDIELLQLMEDLIGDLTAVPQPIEIKLFSDNGALLEKLGPKVAAAIGRVPGVVDVRDGIVPAGDAMEILIDPDKAALENVDPEALTRIISDALTGVVATRIQKGPKLVGVRVWTPAESRATGRDITNLVLRAPDGHAFSLKRVARIETLVGQPEIMREDLKRMVAVTGRISGRDLGSVIRDIKKVLAGKRMIPAGTYFTLGGLYLQQRIAFTGLIAVFIAAVLLAFLLLLFLYERFRVALAMLATTLLSLSGVFLGLWLTGTDINISSMMGMTMIVGIVTEVAIFYYSEYRDLPPDMAPGLALITAGKNRLRPIAMTTLAAILALLPLALGIGQGSAMQKPLAIAIISGLIVQLPLVLIVLPVALHLLGALAREAPPTLQ